MNLITSSRKSGLRASMLSGLGVLALTASIAGCSSNETTESPTSPASSDSAAPAAEVNDTPITVWVDADRQAAADAYIAANPDDPITVETYDGGANGSGTFRTKIQLFDQAGEGWPDVVFSTQNTDAAWASQAAPGAQPYAAALNQGLVPDDIIDGFAEGSLNPCIVDGTVYCLRNDVAHVVTWYDQSLFDEFGYEIPTTWEDYEALGVKLADEHPGYIIGSQGDPWAPEIYMWGSKCQANDVTGAASVTVDTSSDECVRAASMMDTLRDNGTMPNVSVFTPEFIQSYEGKVLMLPGPVWYSGALFSNPDSLNAPTGTIGVSEPLAWGSDDAVTGNVGGATWFISSHSENPALAAKFAEFVTTDPAYQVDLAPGLPAYGAAAEGWVKKLESDGYFATSLDPMVSAANMVWSGWGFGIFSQEAIWAKTMTPGVTEGKSLVDLLPEWQEAIANQAQVDGYTVN